MWDRAEDQVSRDTDTEAEIRLLLIRHGFTKANLEKRYLGRGDEPLSEEGKQRLYHQKEDKKYPRRKWLFSGPMLRCVQSADILFPGVGKYVIPEWTEIDFGVFERKTCQELDGNAQYQAWLESGGLLPFPGGESREAFIRRSMQGFGRMMACLEENKNSSPGQKLWKAEAAAVVHGGTIMALCSSLFGGDYFDYQVKCGEGYDCLFRYLDGNTELMELCRI